MIGKSILHYHIMEKLGQGGMGVVYLAKDNKLERDVAIKFLPNHIAANSDERKRFENEAKAAAALNHPNIATIHAIEETGENLFLVMEYISGQHLKDHINSRALPVEEAKEIAIQIARGIKAAHDKGIVHRDIKSSNIMNTEDNQVKIMDFGLAKFRGSAQLTQIGTTVGTIAYMSPEQGKGQEVDQQTDIWSFGIVLYEMLTGELPFRGEYEQAIIYSILNEEPYGLEKVEKFGKISAIVRRCLEKDCSKRYLHMDEVIEDLQSESKFFHQKYQANLVAKIKKLAILPFSNIMDDPETNFLGFALADQIIGAMAYSKNILVRPSSSVRKYQNEVINIRQAGSDLAVDFVLTGNYLKESDVIRLNIELIEIETEQMIWRERIQIKYTNVFELQDIVAQKVVQGLNVQFSDDERERMKPEAPHNSAAYEIYLRAIAYPSTIEGSKIAIEMLNNSVNLDPLYAPAYLELGVRYNQLAQVGKSTADAFEKAEKALLKALSLKNDFLAALAYLALLYTDIGKHEEAHSLIIRAIKINPNDSWLHFSLCYHYRYIGFLEESKIELEKALAIDPENPRFRSGIITYMFLGEYDKVLKSFNLDITSPFTLNYLGEVAFRKGDKIGAEEYFKKAINVKEEIGEYYFAASFLEYMKGNIEEAAELTHKREAEDPADGEIWYEIARVYGLLGKNNDCYRALEKSIDMGYISYPSMQSDQFLNLVRNDPGIEKLLLLAMNKHNELKQKLSVIY